MTHTRITYTGRVQGVGFRWTCERLARGFAVAGFIQNQPDGSVLLELEGLAQEVEALLAAIDDAMAGNIAGKDIARYEPQGHYGDPNAPGSFVIRR
mgnify:FL=1